MAKNMKYNKTTTESITVKGIMSADGLSIDYVEDKEEHTLVIQDALEKFKNQAVTFTLKSQSDEELPLDDEE